MRTFLVIFVTFCFTGYVKGQGRVAPGVPPQHYQQQQYQQPQFQQVPVQQQQHVQYQQNVQHQQQIPQHQQVHQQVPVQQVHVPVQQQQQQQQQQPPPQHQQQGGHHHHGAPQPGQILNAANIMQEKDHIAEHLEVPIDTSKMTDQELQFHYFKMHDADNNNKLDGCELIKSLIHWHETDDGPKAAFSDEELSQLIDPLIKSFDENNDGFVDYTEFKKNS